MWKDQILDKGTQEMSIPFWRYQDGSDDGCSVYECLSCYKGWEARTNPKYSEWKFCPYCGCTWEGEKEWDTGVKWDRKKGVPLEKDVRLCLPLFVIEKRSVPYDGSEPTEWRVASHGSESYHEVISTLEFHSAQEATSDPFWSKEEYRIRFDPYKDRYSLGKINKKLTWKSSDISKYAIEKWKQHKVNVEITNKKEIEMTEKAS